MALGTEVGLGPGHIMLDGDTAPLPKREQRPKFLAYFYCGQTAGWIKMPLGTEVGVGHSNVALGGVAALPKRGTAPSFRFMSIVAKRLNG